MDDHPSQFELVTAIAMQYFYECRCDIVVLEVGMGGALDSTNVIPAPEVAVITNIGLEHTEYLGSTITEIAAAKAGIIKPGCSAVCYDGEQAATAVVEKVCHHYGVNLRRADFTRLVPASETLDGQRFRYKGTEHAISLLGGHQLKNAAVALETVDALRERDWDIPQWAVERGLLDARWPARLEVLGRLPLFILDGGHNPQCASALAESLDRLLPGEKSVFLMGVLADKDYAAMVDAVLPLAERFICVTPESARALPAGELCEFYESAAQKPRRAGAWTMASSKPCSPPVRTGASSPSARCTWPGPCVAAMPQRSGRAYAGAASARATRSHRRCARSCPNVPRSG